MEEHHQTPLDFEEVETKSSPIREEYRNIRLLAEMLPVFIIAIGLWMKNNGWDQWKMTLTIGGFLASITYLLISLYLYKIRKYQGWEILLSILCGVLFPIGFIGVVFKVREIPFGGEIMTGALASAAVLFILSMVLFVLNLRDARAGVFYRNILARLLIFSTILLILYPLR